MRVNLKKETTMEKLQEVFYADVKITVNSVRGHCAAGYKPGDYFMLKDGLMIEAGKPAGICIYSAGNNPLPDRILP